MSLKDKLEIGLKPDAPYRPDNLPEFQQDDPNCQVASTPGTAAGVEQAREDCDDATPPRRVTAKLKARRRVVTRKVAAAARPAAARRRSAKTRVTPRLKKTRSRSR